MIINRVVIQASEKGVGNLFNSNRQKKQRDGRTCPNCSAWILRRTVAELLKTNGAGINGADFLIAVDFQDSLLVPSRA